MSSPTHRSGAANSWYVHVYLYVVHRVTLTLTYVYLYVVQRVTLTLTYVYLYVVHRVTLTLTHVCLYVVYRATLTLSRHLPKSRRRVCQPTTPLNVQRPGGREGRQRRIFSSLLFFASQNFPSSALTSNTHVFKISKKNSSQAAMCV